MNDAQHLRKLSNFDAPICALSSLTWINILGGWSSLLNLENAYELIHQSNIKNGMFFNKNAYMLCHELLWVLFSIHLTADIHHSECTTWKWTSPTIYFYSHHSMYPPSPFVVNASKIGSYSQPFCVITLMPADLG